MWKSPIAPRAYLFAQTVLVIAALVAATFEDFLAMLFLPLSLDAVSFLGRRAGFLSIGLFSLVMIAIFLFSDAGPLFGLAMAVLYSGLCFLVGGYADQVQSARRAHQHNEQMLSELQSAHRQLQDYADRMESLAVEHARSRLAREMHDSVTQTVFSMNLAAQSAALLLSRDPPAAAGQLLRLEELAASAQQEIQSLVTQLKPLSRIEEDLPAALQRLSAEHRTRDGLQVLLEFHGQWTLSKPVAERLYAIAHEALVNVSKHSGVCEARLRLNTEPELAFLEIADDGRGFDPAELHDRQGHLGLAEMRDRAREIGWDLSVRSRPGHGTCIRVSEKPSGGSA